MKNRRWKIWTLAALATTLSLPAGAFAQEPLEEADAAEVMATFDAPPTIRVANHNWQDMHVYVSRDGGPLQSLGVVTSQTTANFAMPKGFVYTGSGVHVVADPVGSRQTYVSPDIMAVPGTVVSVTIENAINMSSTSLRTHADGS